MFNSEKMKDLAAQNFHDSNQFYSNENYKKFKCKLFIQDDSNSGYGQNYYGQKVTGLERRKKETKNKRRRRYERLMSTLYRQLLISDIIPKKSKKYVFSEKLIFFFKNRIFGFC